MSKRNAKKNVILQGQPSPPVPKLYRPQRGQARSRGRAPRSNLNIMRRYVTHDPTLPTMGTSGVEWMAVSVNPFRQEHRFKDLAPRFPDGTANTVTLIVTSNGVIYGNAAPCGFVTLSPPYAHATTYVGVVESGGDATNGASSPTTTSGLAANETTFTSSIFNTTEYPMRMIAGGIKVTYSGALTHGAGTLRGGWCRRIMLDGAASWTTYHSHIEGLTPEVYQVRDGITVSMPMTHEAGLFDIPRVNQYDALDAGLVPIVQWAGLENAADAVLRIVTIQYIEVQLPINAIPFPLGQTHGERDLAAIVSFANSLERVTEGHSFQSFLKKVGQIAGRLFNFALDNPATIRSVAGLL